MPLILYLALLIWTFSTSQATTQESNPFNLKGQSASNQNAVTDSTDAAVKPWVNPFEPRPSMPSAQRADTQKSPLTDWIIEKNVYKINEYEVKSLLFWGLLFLSFILAIALNINRSVTIKMYRSLVNMNFLSLLYRESREDVSLVFYMLYGLYFIGLSLYLYLVIIHFQGLKAPVYMLYIAGCIIGLYSLKHLSLKLIGYVYGLTKETDRYLFSVVVFSCILAVILIPSNFIISFVSPAIGEKCLILVAFILVILLIYRQLREIAFSINLWQGHIFHFLLYLCTFEIAPVVFIYLYLSRNGVI